MKLGLLTTGLIFLSLSTLADYRRSTRTREVPIEQQRMEEKGSGLELPEQEKQVREPSDAGLSIRKYRTSTRKIDERELNDKY